MSNASTDDPAVDGTDPPPGPAPLATPGARRVPAPARGERAGGRDRPRGLLPGLDADLPDPGQPAQHRPGDGADRDRRGRHRVPAGQRRDRHLGRHGGRARAVPDALRDRLLRRAGDPGDPARAGDRGRHRAGQRAHHHPAAGAVVRHHARHVLPAVRRPADHVTGVPGRDPGAGQGRPADLARRRRTGRR